MNTRPLQTLVPGDGGATVTIDFDGARPEASFSDLFAGLDAAGPVLQLAPPALTEDRQTCADYVGAYALALEAVDEPPALLMGYCVAAVFAHELAVELQEKGRPPARVVLFDAAPVSAAELIGAYERLVRQPPTDSGAFEQLAAELHASGESSRREEVLAELRERLEDRCEAAGVEPGSPVGEELVSRQLDWFSFVLAAVSAPLSLYPGDVTLICSTEQVTPENWPTPRAQRVDLEVPQAEMLAAEEVRQLVSSWSREVRA
jgi:thioesterase domain-containing protein